MLPAAIWGVIKFNGEMRLQGMPLQLSRERGP